MLVDYFFAACIIGIIYLLAKGEHERAQHKVSLERRFRKKLEEYRQACIEYGQCDADAEENYLKKKTEEFEQVIGDIFKWVGK